MITTEQWRSSIGRFCGGRHRAYFSDKTIYSTESNQTLYFKDLCARLFIMSFVMWGLYANICIVSTLKQTDINSLTCKFGEAFRNTTSLFTRMTLFTLCGDFYGDINDHILSNSSVIFLYTNHQYFLNLSLCKHVSAYIHQPYVDLLLQQCVEPHPGPSIDEQLQLSTKT